MAHYAPDELFDAIRGPVFPILTPFRGPPDFEVDLDAVRDYVDWLVAEGAPTVLVTVGTSRFNLLRQAEMLAVNRAVADAVAGRAVAIAAGPLVGTRRENVEFALAAKSAGADAILTFFPERYYGDDHVVAFFESVARDGGLPVLVHEMAMRSGFGGTQQYSLDLIGKLLDLPGVVGLKEECNDGGYAYKLLRRFAGRAAVIGGGGMRRAMRDLHAGARAFLVGIGNLAPRLALEFHAALVAGQNEAAHRIVRTHEDPYFDVACELGWHPALKEALDILGRLPPHERPPMPRLAPEGRARLRQAMQHAQLIEAE